LDFVCGKDGAPAFFIGVFVAQLAEIVGLFLAAFLGNSVSVRTLFGIKTTKKGEHMQKSAAESR